MTITKDQASRIVSSLETLAKGQTASAKNTARVLAVVEELGALSKTTHEDLAALMKKAEAAAPGVIQTALSALALHAGGGGPITDEAVTAAIVKEERENRTFNKLARWYRAQGAPGRAELAHVFGLGVDDDFTELRALIDSDEALENGAPVEAEPVAATA